MSELSKDTVYLCFIGSSTVYPSFVISVSTVFSSSSVNISVSPTAESAAPVAIVTVPLTVATCGGVMVLAVMEWRYPLPVMVTVIVAGDSEVYWMEDSSPSVAAWFKEKFSSKTSPFTLISALEEPNPHTPKVSVVCPAGTWMENTVPSPIFAPCCGCCLYKLKFPVTLSEPSFFDSW